MNYIKNQILQNNAIEAWAMAIRYCDYILEGKATLEYRKYFVSVLHNSVEFIDKKDMFVLSDKKILEWEDVFPFLYLMAAFEDIEENRSVKHLVIDEMQDYTPIQLFYL